MKVRFLRLNFALTTLLLLAVPALRAQDGAEGILARLRTTNPVGQPTSPLSGPRLAIADFDGDNNPDGVVLLEPTPLPGAGSFQIELHFTTHHNTTINFESHEPGITIAATDIDHDGDIDIVLEQSVTHKRLQVWINDGHGNFEKGRIEDYPPAVTPTGDELRSSEWRDFPVSSLPSQRGFETMLIACHVAGRPPSTHATALTPSNHQQLIRAFSLSPSRAPPLS